MANAVTAVVSWLNQSAAEISYLLQQYLDLHSFLIPLGVIGVWRWGVWLMKELVALRYRPRKNPFWATVSLVTPVYNENPQVFARALRSWVINQPTEIIAVIDYTDTACIKIFRKLQKKYNNIQLIVTRTPGKRPALAEGIKAARGEVVALVDSDTIWSDEVLSHSLSPFKDPRVAGVGTYQNVLKPKTLAQKVFDTQLDLRYCDDFPFLAAAGDALVCLSGRTAFYRRKILLPLLGDLVNETYAGQPVISGDDKRLTYLVLAQGWKLAYQSNAHVYTPGMEDLGSYLKQRLRWSRNSLRADLRAMREGWTWKHPALAFFQVDKIFQTLAALLSPIYFTVSLVMGLWWSAAIILIWWLVSRTVKMYPHLRRRPADLAILPAFVIYSFLTALIKLYAFFTLNTQGWITRWDSSRLPKFRFIQTAPAYLATLVVFVFLAEVVIYYQQLTYYQPLIQRQQLITEVLGQGSPPEASKFSFQAGPNISENGLLAKRYVVGAGDSLSSIAGKFAVDPASLLAVNVSRLPNWNELTPGTVLSIPGPQSRVTLPANFNYQRIVADTQRIFVDPATNTIEVYGRGQSVSLAEIRAQVGEAYLSQPAPGEWLLKANLFLHSGTTLNLSQQEVRWLKLKSDQQGYVFILVYNAVLTVDGVKVTSWDDERKDYDNELGDGRSFILAKDGSRMDLYNSELAYLGYSRPLDYPYSSYGVSWRMSTGRAGTALLTGEVINSNFHHNYFGAYTYGATGMVWQGNKFHHNTRYGLDPHDDSNGFIVERNEAFDNGSHGIIFSKRCTNNIIRYNQSYNNKLHGIMLHEKSDHNIIENNTLWNNTDGVAIWDSSNNLVRHNDIYQNKRGVRANVTAQGNILEGNYIDNSSQYGIYLYNRADGNIIRGNTLANNTHAIYIKTANNLISNNVINENQTGVYLAGEAQNNDITANQIIYSNKYGIYAKTDDHRRNYIQNNQLWRNRRDVFAS